MSGGPAVVGLGGGHGLAATLAAARRYARDVTAVVSVADDGGSSGRLRRDFGIPAPGDVRRCLIALAADPDAPWPAACGHRVPAGDVAGHVLGNLVLAGLLATTGSFEAAIDEAGRLLDVRGRVLPATREPVVLTATGPGGAVVGQTALEDGASPIERIAVAPPDAGTPDAVVGAIASADQVVVGPGSLFTSVLAVVAVPAIRAAVAARRGGVVFVCNLRPSKETVGFDVGAHVDARVRHGVHPHAVLFDPATMDLGDLRPPVPVLAGADLARDDGWSHDPGRLGEALRGLLDR